MNKELLSCLDGQYREVPADELASDAAGSSDAELYRIALRFADVLRQGLTASGRCTKITV